MRAAVGPVEFDDLSMDGAVAWIVDRVRSGLPPAQVCTGNLDHLVLLDRDPDFVRVYLQSELVLADGAPVVWLAKIGRNPLCERVAGSDLFWRLAGASAEHGFRLFFLGGKPGAANAAADAVRRRYPDVKICGTYCPPFETFDSDKEQGAIRAEVIAAKPDILLVAFGAPKQEKWIAANRAALEVPVSIGVGGSFEMAAGVVRRAPVWMRRCGLEWFYRFAQEPRRLYRRYFIDDLPYLAKAVVRARKRS